MTAVVDGISEGQAYRAYRMTNCFAHRSLDLICFPVPLHGRGVRMIGCSRSFSVASRDAGTAKNPSLRASRQSYMSHQYVLVRGVAGKRDRCIAENGAVPWGRGFPH